MGAAQFAPHARSAEPSIVLTPTFGPPTQGVSIKGSGFVPYEAITLSFDAKERGWTSANGRGVFSKGIAVPGKALPGSHVVRAESLSGLKAEAAFLVRTEWAQTRFNHRQTGENHYENVLNASNVAQLQVLWRAGFPCSTYSAPAVVEGIVYAGHYCGALYAFDGSTGAVVWRYETGVTGDFIGNPAVGEGRVYSGKRDANELYAFDAKNGAVLWTARAAGVIAHNSPIFTNGFVYVAARDGKLYAFKASTGELMWSAVVGLSGDSAPAVAYGVIYFRADDTGLVTALSIKMGATLWTAATAPGGASDLLPNFSPVRMPVSAPR